MGNQISRDLGLSLDRYPIFHSPPDSYRWSDDQVQVWYVHDWMYDMTEAWHVNILRPRQNGHHFADSIFKCILLNGNVWISINISQKIVSKGQINNVPTLVQILAWRRLGNKPLSEPMMVIFLMHICITMPQWVNSCSGAISVDSTSMFFFRENIQIRNKKWNTLTNIQVLVNLMCFEQV